MKSIKYPVNPADEWLGNYDEIVWFGGILAASGVTTDELQFFYEKPWKWGMQHDKWVALGKPDSYEFSDDDEEVEV